MSKAGRKSENQGEGNTEAAREFNDQAEHFVRNNDPEEIVRNDEPTEAEREEMARARAKGQSRARDKDPAVTRGH